VRRVRCVGRQALPGGMAGVEEVRGAGEVVRGHCGNARTVFGGLPPRMAALRSRGGDGDGGWTPKRSPTTAVPPTRESGTQWRRHRWHRCRVVPSCTPPTPARSFPRPTSAATSFLSSRSMPLDSKSQAQATFPSISLYLSSGPNFFLFNSE
jgi:hypothetical protein